MAVEEREGSFQGPQAAPPQQLRGAARAGAPSPAQHPPGLHRSEKQEGRPQVGPPRRPQVHQPRHRDRHPRQLHRQQRGVAQQEGRGCAAAAAAAAAAQRQGHFRARRRQPARLHLIPQVGEAVLQGCVRRRKEVQEELGGAARQGRHGCGEEGEGGGRSLGARSGEQGGKHASGGTLPSSG